jgi:diguanylate cyclase (GGDEF)-like protein/PAS domain S-box-containing protein
MASKALIRHSLKTKILLGTLTIFLLGLWSLSFYASQMLRQDMLRLSGEQQLSTVSVVAGQVNNELGSRLTALQSVADLSMQAMPQGPAAMQALIEQQPVLQTLFNGGVIVYGLDGAEIADYPASIRRHGVTYMHIDVVAAALQQGRASIGEPVHSAQLKNPIFAMAAPIRDAKGQVVGALAGVINLGIPNFLQGITESRYGNTGTYLIEDPKSRLTITGTDKRRIMQPLPAPGRNALTDRHVRGEDVSGTTISPLGVEVLASAARIPVAGWFMVAALPTSEAFAPIRSMQQRMLLATLLLTLLAGGLTWWLLQRQLSPMRAASDALADMADSSRLQQPLPVTRKDEIGHLVGGFNRLLVDLGQREALLKQIMDTSSVAIFLVDMQGRIMQANQRMADMFGLTLEALTRTDYVALVHPAERAIGQEKLHALLNSELLSVDLDRRYWRADQSEFWGRLTGKRFIGANGEKRGLVGVIADITERRQAQEAQRASEQRFRDMVNTTDGIVWEADATTCTFTFVSAQAERLLGFPMADWLAPGFLAEHLHPDDKAWAPGLCAAHTERLESHNLEFRFIARDGRAVWLRDMVTVVAEQGRPRWLRGLMVDITHTKQMDAVLRSNEARYRAVTHSAHEAIVTTDSSGTIAHWNRGAETIFGYTEAQALGMSVTQLMPPRYHEHHATGFGRWISGTAAHIGGKTSVVHGLHLDGRVFPMELSMAGWETGEGRFATAIMRDISERRQTEANLRIAATAFESQEAMTITDANRVILKVNQAFTRITGYSEAEAVGQTPALLKSGRHDPVFYQTMWSSIHRDKYWQGEIWNRRKSGEIYPERLAISAVLDDQGDVTHYVAAFSDISHDKHAQSEIQHLAFTDALTGLPNRRLLMDRLKHALVTSVRNQHEGALLFIDLDNFKTLNDTLGHDIGDLLLQQVTQRLSTCVRESDTVARVGGDEFVVMLEELSATAAEAAMQAESVGEKILAALKQVYTLAGNEHHSSASIGITLFGNAQETVDELLKRADLAMYSSKTAGRNTLRFFDPQMQTVVSARAALETDMREAVLQGQFLLHYQAQMKDDAVSHARHITGAEVLIRWQHPLRGMVSPAEFIPAAEETGLILPIGQWVLETACIQLAAWATRPQASHLTLAVNVSARQFHHPDFVDQVLTVLARTGANPHRLKLELTESMLVSNVDDIIAKMGVLKAKGVGFSLDDFGTGYSSLSYLKRLPLDQLKIDQGFVRDILVDPNDAAIARTIVALAGSLGLAVIAEGVETEAQKDALAREGCHSYQGYLFSRPLPLDKFETFVGMT